MPRENAFERIDVILIIISVLALFVSVWTWVVSSSIAREVVFLATTISLVISLILITNVIVMIILRMQRRIAHLEVRLSENNTQSRPDASAPEHIMVVTLNNTERRIINALKGNGGKMTQEELRRLTGLSKSTLSVTLGTLERKSIISRSIAGRTKMVVLIQDVLR